MKRSTPRVWMHRSTKGFTEYEEAQDPLALPPVPLVPQPRPEQPEQPDPLTPATPQGCIMAVRSGRAAVDGARADCNKPPHSGRAPLGLSSAWFARSASEAATRP